MFIYLIILASLLSAIGQCLDKHLVEMGINKKDYFYYTCLSVVPFSALMLILEYFTNNLRFEINVIPFIILIIGIFFRYKKQCTVVSCLKYINPYEDSAYLTLGIILAYIIDIILGLENLNLLSIVSIVLTIIGIFILANSKLKIKNLKKDIVIRILSTLIMGYITHYILYYWSNAVYMLFLNLLLILIFSKKYTYQYHKKHYKTIKLVFVQQIFGFSSLYLSNYLSYNSVTLSTYVKPMSIVIIVIIFMFFKDKTKKPNIRQIFAILLVVSGILLIN